MTEEESKQIKLQAGKASRKLDCLLSNKSNLSPQYKRFIQDIKDAVTKIEEITKDEDI